MPRRVRSCLLLISLLLPLSFFDVGAASRTTGTAPVKKAKAPPSYSNEGIPYKDTPLYLVDGYPLTEEELTRFSRRMVLMSSLEGHTKSTPEALLKSYIRFKVVLDEGKRLGLDNSIEFRGALEVNRGAALANDLAAWLKARHVPTEAEIKAIIPESWVQAKFRIKAFRTMEEAAEARAGLESPADFEKLPAPVSLSAEKDAGITGYLFRKSGFFDEFDEVELFKLRTGDISRPIQTGIGAALCLVLDRKEMSKTEQDSYIADKRREMGDRYVNDILKDLASRARYKIHRAALQDAVIAEGRWGARTDNIVLTIDDGAVVLTYRQARILAPVNLTPFFKTYPEASWTTFFEGEVENLARLYELGKEADKRNVSLEKRWEKELYDFRNHLLYDVTIYRLFADANAKATDKEAKQYFEKHKDRYIRPPYVRVKYIYGPNEEEIKTALAKVPEGQSPFTAAELKDRVKEAIFSRSDKTLGSMFDRVFALDPGSRTGIVSGETGYYVFMTVEKDEERKAEFKDVKDRVIGTLVNEKKTKAVADRLEALARKVKVVEM